MEIRPKIELFKDGFVFCAIFTGAHNPETTQKLYDIQIAVSQISGELLRRIWAHGPYICLLFLVGIKFSTGGMFSCCRRVVF